MVTYRSPLGATANCAFGPMLAVAAGPGTPEPSALPLPANSLTVPERPRPPFGATVVAGAVVVGATVVVVAAIVEVVATVVVVGATVVVVVGATVVVGVALELLQPAITTITTTAADIRIWAPMLSPLLCFLQRSLTSPTSRRARHGASGVEHMSSRRPALERLRADDLERASSGSRRVTTGSRGIGSTLCGNAIRTFRRLRQGVCFYRDARTRRLTRYRYNNVPTDVGGRYFFINDGGEVWTPTI